jgi:hypothetical protein
MSIDAMQAMKKANERAWSLQKLPGETDEEFRIRKNLERVRRDKSIRKKGPASGSETGGWASLDE